MRRPGCTYINNYRRSLGRGHLAGGVLERGMTQGGGSDHVALSRCILGFKRGARWEGYVSLGSTPRCINVSGYSYTLVDSFPDRVRRVIFALSWTG